MCYSHFGNGVRNGAISITQWGFINDRYKVNPVDQWGKILVIAMGFVDHLGLEYIYDLEIKIVLVTITYIVPNQESGKWIDKLGYE